MGSSKATVQPRQPGVYRDEPDRDDAASTSSAVLLGDIDDLPNEELPSYSDSQQYTDELSSAATRATPEASDGALYVRRGPGGPTYNPYVLSSAVTVLANQFIAGSLLNFLFPPTVWTGRKSAPSFQITVPKPRLSTACSSSKLRFRLATTFSWLERILKPCDKIIRTPRIRLGTSGLKSTLHPSLAAKKLNACQITRGAIAAACFLS